MGPPAVDLDDPEDRALTAASWRAVAGQPGATSTCESHVRHADGSWVWTEQVFTNLLENPAVDGAVVKVQETTQRRLALQDPLSGLVRRTILLDRVRQALTWDRRGESRAALIVLDVLSRQVIDQDPGQDRGDRVLREGGPSGGAARCWSGRCPGPGGSARRTNPPQADGGRDEVSATREAG